MDDETQTGGIPPLPLMNGETVIDDAPPLPQDALAKMSDDDVDEIILGTEDERDKEREHNRGVIEKIVAVCFWILISYMGITVGSGEVLNEVSGLATSGLLFVLFGRTELLARLASYMGPVWPMAGRIGQRIDKPTPPVIFVFFGWVLLLLSLVIFSIALYQKG